MTVAVSKALEEGATEAVCASTGNTSASAAAYCGRAGHQAGGGAAGGRDRPRKAGPGPDLRRPGDRRAGQLRRRAAAGARAGRAAAGGAAQLDQPVPPGGAEDGRLRGAGAAGRRPRLAGAAGRKRRQHHRLLEGLRRDGRWRRGCWPGQAAGRRAADHARAGRQPASPSRPRSGSATRPGWTRRWRRWTTPAAASGRSTTRASWPPTGCSPRRRACSASRPRRPRWRRCWRPLGDGLVEPGARVVCVLTGHGLKDPDTAGQEGAEILRCPPAIERLERLAFDPEPVGV